jgi:uncharacterized alkaline shock family protein YloU
VEGNARISPDVLARYAADAAREVPGVRGLVDSRMPGRRAVRIATENGAPIPTIAREVQTRIADHLGRTADSRPARVDVVVEQIGPG